jgi:hypothetical protein
VSRSNTIRRALQQIRRGRGSRRVVARRVICGAIAGVRVLGAGPRSD